MEWGSVVCLMIIKGLFYNCSTCVTTIMAAGQQTFPFKINLITLCPWRNFPCLFYVSQKFYFNPIQCSITKLKSISSARARWAMQISPWRFPCMATLERRRTSLTLCKLDSSDQMQRVDVCCWWCISWCECVIMCVWCDHAGLLWKPTPPSPSYSPRMWTLASYWWWSCSGRRTPSLAGPGGTRTLSTFARCASNLGKHSPGD